MKMIGLKLGIGLCVATLSTIASAMPITGVSVTTTFESPGAFGTVIESVVDGSGLSSYTTGAMHELAFLSNSWAAIGFSSGSIRFDLGDVFDVDGMAVWNFNAPSSIGINDITITSSVDGVSLTPIPGAPMNFAIGVVGSELAEVFSFTATARYIRFDVTSNHQGPGPAIGLNEVIFTGSRIVDAPVPATIVLFGLGLAGLVWSRHRKL